MHYILSNPHPQSRYIHISVQFKAQAGERITLKLSNWRPGRYELGNFAKYVRGMEVRYENGHLLKMDKSAKNAWEFITDSDGLLNVSYQYFGYGIDAGSSFCSDDLLYVNPINCLVYRPETMLERCSLALDIPQGWQVAIALKKTDAGQYWANDFHELADSPFIASPNLEHHTVSVDGAVHHLWIQGQHTMDISRFATEVEAYTHEQVALFGDFPAKEFHYLIHFLPHQFRHGVEHSYSTVIVNGPGEQFHEAQKHNDMLAICSHELFHFWNVKRLRPAEMWPYDYEQENYARTGYIYEGITTYYGDYILLRSGVFSFDDWSTEIGKDLKRHFENEGRFYYSVAESSFDTWLDGYANIAPARKTSIYVEGMLGALMLDFELRHQSNHAVTLDDWMRRLYFNFYKKGKGYTEEDLVKELSALANRDMRWFFERYYWGCGEIEKALPAYLAMAGIEMVETPARAPWERFFGMRLNGDGRLVTLVIEDSPAAKAGIAQGDLVSFNLSDENVGATAADRFAMQGAEAGSITVTVKNVTGTVMREIAFDGKEYLPEFSVVKKDQPTPEQDNFFKNWAKSKITTPQAMIS